MNPSPHETLANRLADILIQAMSGRPLKPSELAVRYSVSSKTIRRDFGRLSSGLEKCETAGEYRLTSRSGALFFEKDLVRLITALGLKKALPGKTARFLNDFINNRNSDCYHFQEPPLELASIDALHAQFENAIKARRMVQFQYKGRHREVQPYLMVYSRGAWYLAGIRDGELKAYAFARIKLLTVTEQTFAFDSKVIQQIKDYDSIWFGQPAFEVLLEVNPEVAMFFERKALLPIQKILEKMPDGSLIISASAHSCSQIAPLVQYWLPNIRVIEPRELNDYVCSNLEQWINDYRRSLTQ